MRKEKDPFCRGRIIIDTNHSNSIARSNPIASLCTSDESILGSIQYLHKEGSTSISTMKSKEERVDGCFLSLPKPTPCVPVFLTRVTTGEVRDFISGYLAH